LAKDWESRCSFWSRLPPKSLHRFFVEC